MDLHKQVKVFTFLFILKDYPVVIIGIPSESKSPLQQQYIIH